MAPDVTTIEAHIGVLPVVIGQFLDHASMDRVVKVNKVLCMCSYIFRTPPSCSLEGGSSEEGGMRRTAGGNSDSLNRLH